MFENAVRGAVNMLRRCAHAVAGERLLVAFEPPEFGYYEAGALDCVTEVGRQLGLDVTTLDVGFAPGNPVLSTALSDAINTADITVFLARLGDQMRFSGMPAGKRVVVSYAISPDMFASGFGQLDHHAMIALKEAVGLALQGTREVRLTCPSGTDVVGRPEMNLSPGGDTSILRFPLSVPTPVPAHSFSGRVALPGFLTGTGSMYYEPYTMEFDGPVHALMNSGRLTGFEGGDRDVQLAAQHYDYVSSRFKIDRNFVHSWHAGIHPGCAYHQPARQNYERWSGAAFGNPRLLHFHTCGAYAPGEISWNVVDPTITLDGLAIWESGRFRPERLPGGRGILNTFPDLEALCQVPETDIGLLGALV